MNFKHLHYFWVAAHAGGIVKAGEQLHISPQTLSGQIKLLEEALDKKLFRKNGRTIELTDAGRLALDYADEIFSLGSELESAVRRESEAGAQTRFRVGIADSVPKAIAYRLLEPALSGSVSLRMICHEGKLHALLAQLAVHRLDLIIADAPIPADVNIKAFNHRLGRSTLSCFGAQALIQSGKKRFPLSLGQLPVLLPGTESAVRRKLDHWLASHAISPRIVGEFDDGAMTMAFGREGRGVLFAPTVLENQLQAEHDLTMVGQINSIVEEFFAISIERRISHPAVAMIMDAARSELFNG
ncbi:bacterial regulatory helix-turn-helix, lysR family protein [Paraburkholderia xenovorans LB400]|uniref:Transcriptional regulator, LysR family n=1 Tax=Paraburkholderia xenovorans (strain LB400) TaxID=266265 RepID=Q13PU6_PARXL|nr:transcriptional activator NhaR [Paraburkholderia xenovorans]ABE33893.1 transcriptional regulator, LysR family [Paraburkholderia xenovorans LB400]AIP35411.1 bacterial regulatory helix-turn-helix, lysR family protein [Paraburkholderia xenovorans LB400]NPT35862.1 transcriptional activator NhaR [Paraburkholderia xenovorans]